jgi:hypothetical protein
MKARISSILLVLLALAAVALHPARLFPAGVAGAPETPPPAVAVAHTAEAPRPVAALEPVSAGMESIAVPAVSGPLPPERLSPGMEQVIKLARAATPDSVMIAFIENAGIQYNPTPDELFLLRELQVSEKVLVSLIQRKSKGVALAAAAPANTTVASSGMAATAQASPPGIVPQTPITIHNNVSVPTMPALATLPLPWCPPVPACGPYSFSSPSGRFRIYSNGHGYGAPCDSPVLVIGPRSAGGHYLQPYGPGYSTPLYGPGFGYLSYALRRPVSLGW